MPMLARTNTSLPSTERGGWSAAEIRDAVRSALASGPETTTANSSGAIASNFARSYRYTASALTSDFAWLFGAGFAPLAALLLATHFGLISAGAYLLSGAVWTLLALWLSGLREAEVN